MACWGPPAASGARSSCGTSTGKGAGMRVLKNPEGPAYDMAFSPDSRWLLTRRNGVAIGAMPSGDLAKVLGASHVYGAALSPTSLLVLSDRELIELDPATGNHLRACPLGESRN